MTLLLLLGSSGDEFYSEVVLSDRMSVSSGFDLSDCFEQNPKDLACLEKLSGAVWATGLNLLERLSRGVPSSSGLMLSDKMSGGSSDTVFLEKLAHVFTEALLVCDTLSRGVQSSTMLTLSETFERNPDIIELEDRMNRTYVSTVEISEILNRVFRTSIVLDEKLSPGERASMLDALERFHEKDVFYSQLLSIDRLGRPKTIRPSVEIATPPGRPGTVMPVPGGSGGTPIPITTKYIIYIDGMPVNHRITSSSISLDESSVHNTLELSSSDRELFYAVNPKKHRGECRVEVHIGTKIYKFIIDARKPSGEHQFSLSCLSLSARNEPEYLTEDWSAPVLEEPASAKEVAETLLPHGRIVWEIADWPLPAGFEFDADPITCLQTIAGKLRAIVRSGPGEEIVIRKEWPTRPVYMQKQKPDVSYDRTRLVSISGPEIRYGEDYNAIMVSGVGSDTSESPTLEVEESSPIIGQTVHVRAYWPGNEPPKPLETYLTAGEIIDLGEHSHVFPIVEKKEDDDDDDEPVEDRELITFTEGKASVSHPITKILKFAWIGKMPGSGEYKWTPHTKDIVLSDGLWAVAKIKYESTYRRYQIVRHRIEHLLAVFSYYNPASVAVIVEIGAGDKSAPPVSDNALTTEAACVERGTAELDAIIYDTELTSFAAPHHDDCVDGSTAFIQNENVECVGNNKVRRVTIRMEGPAIWDDAEVIKCLSLS